jgi:hypothetical protein
MHVADLCNTKAAKLLWRSPQPYVDVLGNQVPWLQKKRVGASDGGDRRSTDQKSAEKSFRVSKFWPRQKSSIAFPNTMMRMPGGGSFRANPLPGVIQTELSNAALAC